MVTLGASGRKGWVLVVNPPAGVQLIGERTAEEIKVAIGSAWPVRDEVNAEVRGRDLMSGLPKTIILSPEEVAGVVAHELAHVLMDSGEHDNRAGNLMAESTSPQNTQLTAAQCERLGTTGQRNGLLRGVD